MAWLLGFVVLALVAFGFAILDGSPECPARAVLGSAYIAFLYFIGVAASSAVINLFR